MSTLGEVVYCTDCDLARAAGADAAGSNSTAFAERPRRMATKRDANGEPLCTACLDARLMKRRAEFLLNQGRAPLPSSPPVAQDSSGGAVQRRKADRPTFIRIVRTSSTDTPAREPARRSTPQKRTLRSEPKQPPPAPRLSKARARVAEKRFVMLAGEIGFLRAQELMDGLKSRLRGESRPARR